MLPDFRFIAASVLATVAMMMFGFGLFAAFRLANQSSVVLARTSDVAPPPVFADRAPARPSIIAVPNPPASELTPGPPAGEPTPGAVAAAQPVPDLPASAPTDPVPAPTTAVETPSAEAPAVAEVAPPKEAAEAAREEAAIAPAADRGPVDMATSTGTAAAAELEPLEPAPVPTAAPPPAPAADAAPAAAPVAAAMPPAAEPAAVALPAETTGSLNPTVDHHEVRAKPRAAATPQVKKRAAAQKPRVRHVRRVVRPAQPAQQSDPFATFFQQPSRQTGGPSGF